MDSKTPVAQDEAIKTAEVIFHYTAKSYLETSTSHDDATTTQAPKVTVKPPIRTLSFLASACAFQRPLTATSATTIPKRTLLEELADELDRYFRFESAPVEQQEGDEQNREPSAEEVLLNPLLWWKVSILSAISSLLTSKLSY